jgi:hypothetical protein
MYLQHFIGRNPNGFGLTAWLPYRSNSQFYKQLSVLNVTNGDHYRKEYVKFWDTINAFEFLCSAAVTNHSLQNIHVIVFILVFALKMLQFPVELER